MLAFEAQGSCSGHVTILYYTVLLEHVTYEVCSVCLDAIEVYECLGVRSENKFKGSCILGGILPYVFQL